MPQADNPAGGFRPFFNPATGEWITCTATRRRQRRTARPLHLAQRPRRRDHRAHPPSPGRALHHRGRPSPLHPQRRAAHSRTGRDGRRTRPASRTPRETPGRPRSRASSSSARPCRAKEWHEALAGLWPTARPPQGRAEEPAPARRHLLALPERKPGHLTARLGAEPHAPPAVGTGQGLRRPPLLRPLGQPDLSSWCARPGLPPLMTAGDVTYGADLPGLGHVPGRRQPPPAAGHCQDRHHAQLPGHGSKRCGIQVRAPAANRRQSPWKSIRVT